MLGCATNQNIATARYFTVGSFSIKSIILLKSIYSGKATQIWRDLTFGFHATISNIKTIRGRLRQIFLASQIT